VTDDDIAYALDQLAKDLLNGKSSRQSPGEEVPQETRGDEEAQPGHTGRSTTRSREKAVEMFRVRQDDTTRHPPGAPREWVQQRLFD
jgi:hypothetical protein